MHVELQENGVHVHISIDEKKFPALGTQNLYDEAKGALSRIQESRIESNTETVKASGQYL